MSIIKEMNDLYSSIAYDKKAIIEYKKDIEFNKLNMDSEGFHKESGLYLKGINDNKIEMINRRLLYISNEETKLKELTLLKNNMLKYFNKNMNNKTIGTVLKLLSKKYQNSFKDKGLNGYSVELWQLINHAIENNLNFYLQFKTLINNCIKVYDSDLKEWL